LEAIVSPAAFPPLKIAPPISLPAAVRGGSALTSAVSLDNYIKFLLLCFLFLFL